MFPDETDSGSKGPSITFIQRNPISCPICDAKIYREELLSGRGRLIAGDLTIELRRLYDPSQKYGEVFPLIYPITVCPDCYYAAWKEDFTKLPEDAKQALDDDRDARIQSVHSIVGPVSFDKDNPRGLVEGLVSYYLAIRCYDHFHKDVAPVAKQAVSCLRAAWICNDLERLQPGENFGHLGRTFYRKARYFYALTLEYEQKGLQTITNVANLGPDLDKNYGYDGLIYLVGYLEFHFGPRNNAEQREANLKKAKHSVARIFGMGKASKNKPMVLLDNAREVYNMIAAALGQENADPEADAKSSD